MVMTAPAQASSASLEPTGTLIYRQSAWTRFTHWIWAISLFFLLLTGLQIFNAHPKLYIGDQSGFQFKNDVLAIGAENTADGPKGYTTLFGAKFETTGVLGLSGAEGDRRPRAFPAWATIPSSQDLGTGRIIHFFFAWILVATLAIWLVASAINGHLRRDLTPSLNDLKQLPADIASHARLRFHHTREYNVLQKLAYGGVMFVLFPLIILTGLAMSPSVNAAAPWLADILGGRQTARTLHFVTMLLMVLFFFVHIAMIVAAGPINELRSILTGWYRTDPPAGSDAHKHGA